MRLPLEIPSSGPLYDGHFPGHPILPGVGLLDLALRALAGGVSPSLRGIPSLRFRRLVVPGEMLRLSVEASAPNRRTRLEVFRGAEIVSNGIVLLGEPPPATETSRFDAGREPSEVRDLDDLLPHRPPMRLVEKVEAQTDDGVTCAVRVPERSAFDVEGSAPALVALEMAAQAAALFEALRRVGDGARIGYLVGARDVRFARARLPAGESLLATVRLSAIALPLSTYAFEVAHRHEVVASGTVSTWLTATDA